MGGVLSNKYNMQKRNGPAQIQTYDLDLSSSVDNKLPYPRAGKSTMILPHKIKTGANFSLQKTNSCTLQDSLLYKTPQVKKEKAYLKLPVLKKADTNPQYLTISNIPDPYYQSKILKALRSKDNTYFLTLAHQHFIQTVEALRIGKGLKIKLPQKDIKLSKKHPKFKTIYLDMDETLIHCDETSSSYTIKLDFPIDNGETLAAGIRIRPYCEDFLRELSSFAEIIIFTASSASYADIILDHLDPSKKYFSHRLYRQHCTLQKGFFVKDLRVVNRRLQDSLLVDNSAFSFMLQPENGVPIIPFYHLAKDKELVALLDFLKRAVQYADMRDCVRRTFFWEKYLSTEGDPRKIFQRQFGDQRL